MDRKDFFFRQRVTQAELDEAFLAAEIADQRIVEDILGFGFIVSGPNPATVIENTAPDSNVLANVLLGYDQSGRRLSNLLSGFQGGVDAGLPPQLVDILVDEVGAATTVATPGNEKTIAIFVEFTRNQTDPRLDGNGATVFFKQDESIQFNVVQSAEAALGTSVPPPLRGDQILLADVVRIFAQTTFLNADIDQTRREDFALSLLHGSTHTETGSDAIPIATTGEGGLHSAADKTAWDAAAKTVAEHGGLFQTFAGLFQPANIVAPAATSLDVTGSLAGKSAGGSTSAEGVVTQTGAPNNRVTVKDDDFDDFTDANGNKVFARLTVDNETTPTAWTLAFFVFDETTGEIAFDMTPFGGAAVLWWITETYLLHNLPTFSLIRIPSDQVAGEVPVATTTAPGKVLSALGAPATPVAGVFNVFENNGSPLAGGPWHTFNWIFGGATSPSAGQVDVPVPIPSQGKVLQRQFVRFTANQALVNTGMASPPAINEGTSVGTLAITPLSTTSTVVCRGMLNGHNTGAAAGILYGSVSRLGVASASAAALGVDASTSGQVAGMNEDFASGVLTAQTWHLRGASSAGGFAFTANNNTGFDSWLELIEYEG